MSILLYGCTTRTLTECMGKKLNGNCTRMLRAILSKSWKQHPTKKKLYGHLPPISKAIQIRRTRHEGHFWRCKDEHISDVLRWTLSHGCASVGRPTWTYLQQLCTDTGCCLEYLLEVKDGWDEWREREGGRIRETRARDDDDDDNLKSYN